MKFAGPLKAMVRALLAEVGIVGEFADRHIEGDLKERPIPELGGFTCRFLMQTLGTEWGRDTLRESFWVDIMAARVGAARREHRSVVIDDMRYPNEHAKVVDLGGDTVKVIRPGHEVDEKVTSHTSENGLDDFKFDTLLWNKGTVEDLQKGARKLAYLYNTGQK